MKLHLVEPSNNNHFLLQFNSRCLPRMDKNKLNAKEEKVYVPRRVDATQPSYQIYESLFLVDSSECTYTHTNIYIYIIRTVPPPSVFAVFHSLCFCARVGNGVFLSQIVQLECLLSIIRVSIEREKRTQRRGGEEKREKSIVCIRDSRELVFRHNKNKNWQHANIELFVP